MPPGTRCTTREAIRDPTSTPADTAELMSEVPHLKVSAKPGVVPHWK